MDNLTVRGIDDVINVPNIGQVIVTRHAQERFVERLSDAVSKHPRKALCSKLLCSTLTRAQLPERVTIQKAKFWQHVGSKMHFVMTPGDSMKMLVTVFAVKQANVVFQISEYYLRARS